MHRQGLAWVMVAALAGAVGCGSDNEQVLEDAQGQNCAASDTYEAFDVANHASQDERVAAQAAIAAKADEAIADPTKAAAAFAAIEILYQQSADLQEKVKGRKDDHAPGDADADAVGAEMDAAIVLAIARGEAATTALDASIAKQIIDKSLTRFFYLSTYHELVLGARDKYDEAYGYLGTGPRNVEADLKSVAKVAKKRDAANGTDLSGDLFRAIRGGSCALDKRLIADGAESVAWTADEGYALQVRTIDELMEDVLALSVGHEMFELAELDPVADADEAKVKVYEGAYFFYAIEQAMERKGGAAAADAAAVRAMFDDAIQAIEAGDDGWAAAFDAAAIEDKVAAAFGVTVKG